MNAGMLEGSFTDLATHGSKGLCVLYTEQVLYQLNAELSLLPGFLRQQKEHIMEYEYV